MAGFSGGCLCGAVRYTSKVDPARVLNCHCVDCRKSTGASYGTNAFVPADQVELTGTLHVYEHSADSGNTMTKHFCPNCGSLVYGTSTGRPNILSIRAGSIDDKDVIKPAANLYLKSRIPATPLDEEIAGWEAMPEA